MSYRAHESEWCAAITAVTGHGTFTRDDIPDPMPPTFAVVSVTRRVVDVMRFDASRARLGWRLEVESVGTSRDEVQWMRERVMRLSDKPRVAIESSQLIPDGDADDPSMDEKFGRWSAVDSWTYYAPNPNI